MVAVSASVTVWMVTVKAAPPYPNRVWRKAAMRAARVVSVGTPVVVSKACEGRGGVSVDDSGRWGRVLRVKE